MIPRQLPEEIIMAVFSYLNTQDLGRVANACKDWDRLSNDSRLWALLLAKDFNVLYDINATEQYGITSPKEIYKLFKAAKPACYALETYEDNFLKDSRVLHTPGKLQTNNLENIMSKQDTLFSLSIAQYPEDFHEIYDILKESLHIILRTALENVVFARKLLDYGHISNRELIELLLITHASKMPELNLGSTAFYGNHQNCYTFSVGLGKLAAVNNTTLKSLILPSHLILDRHSFNPIDLNGYLMMIARFPNLHTITFKISDADKGKIIESNVDIVKNRLDSKHPNISFYIETESEKRLIAGPGERSVENSIETKKSI